MHSAQYLEFNLANFISLVEIHNGQKEDNFETYLKYSLGDLLALIADKDILSKQDFYYLHDLRAFRNKIAHEVFKYNLINKDLAKSGAKKELKIEIKKNFNEIQRINGIMDKKRAELFKGLKASERKNLAKVKRLIV